MKSILSKDFRYTPSASTNIRLTFRRVREAMKREQDEREAAEAEARVKVKTMPRAAAAKGK